MEQVAKSYTRVQDLPYTVGAMKKTRTYPKIQKNWNYEFLLRKIKCPPHHSGMYYKPHYPI
jgi:hypothetical protein